MPRAGIGDRINGAVDLKNNKKTSGFYRVKLIVSVEAECFEPFYSIKLIKPCWFYVYMKELCLMICLLKRSAHSARPECGPSGMLARFCVGKCSCFRRLLLFSFLFGSSVFPLVPSFLPFFPVILSFAFLCFLCCLPFPSKICVQNMFVFGDCWYFPFCSVFSFSFCSFVTFPLFGFVLSFAFLCS